MTIEFGHGEGFVTIEFGHVNVPGPGPGAVTTAKVRETWLRACAGGIRLGIWPFPGPVCEQGAGGIRLGIWPFPGFSCVRVRVLGVWPYGLSSPSVSGRMASGVWPCGLWTLAAWRGLNLHARLGLRTLQGRMVCNLPGACPTPVPDPHWCPVCPHPAGLRLPFWRAFTGLSFQW